MRSAVGPSGLSWSYSRVSNDVCSTDIVPNPYSSSLSPPSASCLLLLLPLNFQGLAVITFNFVALQLSNHLTYQNKKYFLAINPLTNGLFFFFSFPYLIMLPQKHSWTQICHISNNTEMKV